MSRTKKGLAIALTAIMVLSVFAVAPATADASTSGQVLVVDDDHGSDHNDDNDNDLDYETIQGAVDDAEPGDSIEVRAGTYNENVLVDVGDITIEGAGASQVTVTGTGGPGVANSTVVLGADDIDFSGFTVVANEPDGTPAIAVYDLIDDSHVKGVLVEDNVFVGNDNTTVLGYATPPSGTEQSRDLTIRNNEFTGGTVGSMTFGFILDASGSTMAGNTFDTKVDQSSLYVTGPDNTIIDTTIEYPGYALTGAWIEGPRTTVDTMSVDGHPDAHLHENQTRGDWLKYGVAVTGSGSSLNDVESVESHVGMLVTDTSGVSVTNSMGADNRNHDLKIADSDNVEVNNFDAMSEVMSEETWTDFQGTDPTSGANVFVVDGYKHNLVDVTSRSESPIGIAMHNVDKSTIDGADIANKVGGSVDLGGFAQSTTGITLNNSDGNTVTNSLVENNDAGIAIHDGDDNALVGNNPGIYNNTNEGVLLDDADDTLLEDNDVQDNGVGLHAVDDSDNTRAKYNNFVGNGDGIVVSSDSDVDARWNWFGNDNGPSGPATDGVLSGDGDSIVGDDLEYDPFLTAPKDEVIQDSAKTQQYAHDFETHGSQGVQTIGSPGPADVEFQFSSGSNAMVWTYDGSFNQVMSANTQADALEGYIITNLNANENARVVVDFSDANVASFDDGQLNDGWNFVAAPQYGDTEDVMRSTTEILRLTHVYDQFDSQPYPQGDASTFAYTMDSNGDGPDLSAFTGYWVRADGSGELTTAIPAGVTIDEESGLIQNP